MVAPNPALMICATLIAFGTSCTQTTPLTQDGINIHLPVAEPFVSDEEIAEHEQRVQEAKLNLAKLADTMPEGIPLYLLLPDTPADDIYYYYGDPAGKPHFIGTLSAADIRALAHSPAVRLGPSNDNWYAMKWKLPTGSTEMEFSFSADSFNGIGVGGGYLDNETIHQKIADMIERFARSIGAEVNEYRGICLKNHP